MKGLFTVLFSLLLSSGYAQISITNSSMPQAGDSLRFSIAALDTTVLFNYQKSGANQQWSFDSLEAIRQGVNRFFNSSNTPYSSQVTNRIGQKLADTLSLGGINLYDVYDFFNNTSSEFAKDYRAASVPTGLSFPFPPVISIAPSFSDRDEVYQFPLNYQDRDSSTFAFSYSNSLVGAYYGSNGYRINEVDAWGALTTPFGTFNCLRVITDVVSYDTVSFNATNFGVNSHTREYKWLTPQFGIPAMTVSGNMVAGTFIPTNVQYRDSVRNVPSIFAPIALFNADTTLPAINDTVTLNNQSISLTPPSYRWTITPSNFQYVNGTSSSSMSPQLIFTSNGTYDVQLIISNNEGSDTLLRLSYITVSPVSSQIEYSINAGTKLFPNPQRAGLPIWIENKTGKKISNIKVIDIQGKILLDLETDIIGKTLLPTQMLTSGQYLIKSKYIDGSHSVVPLLIR